MRARVCVEMPLLELAAASLLFMGGIGGKDEDGPAGKPPAGATLPGQRADVDADVEDISGVVCWGRVKSGCFDKERS